MEKEAPQEENETEILTVGIVTLNPGTRFLTVKGKTEKLGPKQNTLLALLMRRPGKLVSRSDIIREVYKGKPPASRYIIAANANLIRKKLGDAAHYLKTAGERGAKFEVPK
jgi:DNA-binding response OmpR family regulator